VRPWCTTFLACGSAIDRRFSGWLLSTGWPHINDVLSASLLNLQANPPAPADPAEIALVAGGAPTTPALPGYAVIGQNGQVVQFLVQTGDAVATGRVFRLDIKVTSRDCGGRVISTRDCTQISISSC
jgi:hypothetical protein